MKPYGVTLVFSVFVIGLVGAGVSGLLPLFETAGLLVATIFAWFFTLLAFSVKDPSAIVVALTADLFWLALIGMIIF